MTRVHGIVDFIGPSGGAYVPDGNYALRASGITHLCSIYNDMQIDTHGGNTTISGQNIYLHASGSIVSRCNSIFRIGHANYISTYTPASMLFYCRGGIIHKTENGDILMSATRSGDANNYNAIQVKVPATGSLEITTINGYYVVHRGPPGDPFPTYSGLVDFNITTGMIDANASGIKTYSPNNIILDSAETIHLYTGHGKRPDINGSGIATLCEMCDTYWHGALTANQSITASASDLLWDTVSSQGNLTHTNGTKQVYLESSKKYTIDIVLESNYNIGGHQQDVILYHYNGVFDNILTTQSNPTSPQNRNWAFAKYVISLTATAGQYVYARAKNTIAQSGKTYLKANTVMIVKELIS